MKKESNTISVNETGVDRKDIATQWQLMWWRFKRHKMALISLFIVIGFYFIAFIAEFLSTGTPHETNPHFSYCPPQTIHWFDNGSFRPYVENLTGKRDPETYMRVFTLEPDNKVPIHFFAHGDPYKFLGLFEMDRHLFSIQDVELRTDIYWLGSDELGRDLWSRLIYGTRISLSIGLIGVTLSLILGITLGGISGYFGGFIDSIIQRSIEFVRSIPTIPLWMGLAAALPKDWSIIKIYFAITLIISLFGWTSLARVVRGKFLALREEDYVMAARLSGCSTTRIIFRHMLPSFTSHIIAATTLAIPAMIISETALSFLGLGLRAPAISWGVLLQRAQNIQTVALYPWLMLPALAVIVAVLAFNFLGDGLRDAADPYARGK